LILLEYRSGILKPQDLYKVLECNPQASLCAQRDNVHNASFFTDTVIPNLIETVRSRNRRKKLKDWLIQVDNAGLHNLGRVQRCIQASRAERRPDPDYSADLAPGDFFLFGSIKGRVSDCNFEGPEDLLSAITDIFTGVNQGVLLNAFEPWVNWLKWVIKHKGKCHTK
jgi:hypothetical protein